MTTVSSYLKHCFRLNKCQSLEEFSDGSFSFNIGMVLCDFVHKKINCVCKLDSLNISIKNIFLNKRYSQDGYDIKLRSIKNCGDSNQIVKILKNSTTTVNENCEVFSFTCADIKTYHQATVSQQRS